MDVECNHSNVSYFLVIVNGHVDVINVKSDPSAVLLLQSFLCEKSRIYWSNTITSFSKLDTYMSSKNKFVWKSILIQYQIEHIEFGTQK